jgi:asparagine synthase (glutamine-hydrolysing)
MCGIAGFLAPYSREVAERMGQRIAHRGPDSTDLMFDAESRIALVHRRLAIIDLSSAGAQPMEDSSGRYVICYNGEIYNFLELRKELLSQGVCFRGNSDTEVIVEYFARHGDAVFPRLNGIFALAIWDRREMELVLARDGLGVKPLYIRDGLEGFAFASELKALLELPDLDRTLDPVAAVAYLSYLYSPGERTMFRSVRKLRPGSVLRIRSGQASRESVFYRIPAVSPIQRTDAEAIAGTLSALDHAVERQLIADVDVGAFLSGGLDSSAIVALARKHMPKCRMQCFTIDYDGRSDEAAELETDLPYGQQAARHLDIDLHVVRVDANMADMFEQLVYTLDEPQADPAALNSLQIAALARQHGIKVLLSGAGGDDILTGYRRHQAASYDRIWDFTPGALRSALASMARRLPLSPSLARRARKLLEHVDRGGEDRLMAYFEWLSPDNAAALLIEDDPMLADAARVPMRDVLARYPGSAVERTLKLDQHFFLTDHNLNYTDKTGMAHGVEIRVPFLDLEFIDWAATLPADIKMRRGETKWVLRKAMEGILPSNIIYRPKTGFGVPLRSWLRNELRPMLEDTLAPDVVERRGLFSATRVSALKNDTLAGRIDGSYALLGLMAIELWCRRFVDVDSKAQIPARANQMLV